MSQEQIKANLNPIQHQSNIWFKLPEKSFEMGSGK